MSNILNFDSDVCAMTDTGLVRPHNEDSNRVARTSNGVVFVVCDGMGGHAGGATASRIGVDSVCQYLSEQQCDIPQQFLTKALEYANSQIYAQACSNSELTGMGTTACVALVRDDKVWYAHVGDSRIYYFNAKHNSLYRLTKDHSVVQALVDRGEITEAEAEHHPEKNKIRKSLGIKMAVEPEPCQMPLIPAKGDMILLCSDGLSGMMEEEDILEVLSTATDVNEAGKVLIDLAKSGGGTDNITVQIVRFSDADNRDAVFDAKNKGVSFQSKEKNEGKTIKHYWPWIVIAASVIMIFVAGLLLFPGSPKEEKKDDTSTSNTITRDGFAYEKAIPQGAVREEYIDGVIEYVYYKHPNNPKGNLRVNMNNYSYCIGEFEARPIIIDGKQVGTQYDPKDVIEFNRYGEIKSK